MKVGLVGMGMMGRFHAACYFKMPGVELAAIADAADSLADTIGQAVLTTDPQSPARLPGFIDREEDARDALRRLDWLFHDRTPEESNAARRERWQRFCEETGQQAHPADPQAVIRFGLWEREIPGRLGAGDEPSIRERLTTYDGLTLAGPLLSGWPKAATEPYRSLWRTVAGLKIYFGHLPIYALNSWQRAENGWIRATEPAESFESPARPKQGIVGGRLRRVDDGLPVEWLESLRLYAGQLRAAVGPPEGPAPEPAGTAGQKPAGADCHVTLLQVAPLVNRSKRTLERWQAKDSDFPPADVEGGGGNAAEWRWSVLRPYLAKKSCRELPADFPANPLRPGFGSAET